MGFFSSSEGKPIALARAMLIRRVSEDSAASAHGFSSSMVKELTAAQIAGSAEATIAVIVEAVANLTFKNYDENASILQVERHRKQIGQGPLPTPLSLQSYVKYRVKTEYPSLSFPDGHIDWCISASIHLFQHIDDKGEIRHAISHADNEFLSTRLARVMNAIENILDCNENCDEDHIFMQDALEQWKTLKRAAAKKRATHQFRAALRDM